MKTINVLRAFRLTLGDHSVKDIAKGPQEVDDEIADHWYTQHHIADNAPALGSREYAVAARKTADDAEAGAHAAITAADEAEKRAQAAEIAAGLRTVPPQDLGAAEPVKEPEIPAPGDDGEKGPSTDPPPPVPDPDKDAGDQKAKGKAKDAAAA